MQKNHIIDSNCIRIVQWTVTLALICYCFCIHNTVIFVKKKREKKKVHCSQLEWYRYVLTLIYLILFTYKLKQVDNMQYTSLTVIAFKNRDIVSEWVCVFNVFVELTIRETPISYVKYFVLPLNHTHFQYNRLKQKRKKRSKKCTGSPLLLVYIKPTNSSKKITLPNCLRNCAEHNLNFFFFYKKT